MKPRVIKEVASLEKKLYNCRNKSFSSKFLENCFALFLILFVKIELYFDHYIVIFSGLVSKLSRWLINGMTDPYIYIYDKRVT